LRVINKTNNKTWQWKPQDNGAFKKELVKQTIGNNWAIRKPLHEDTFYGKILNGQNDGKLKIRTVLDTSFDKKKIEDKVVSGSIKKILLNHLSQEIFQNVKDDKGRVIKSCELAFSDEGIEGMNRTIVNLNDGKYHNPIKKITLLHERGKKFSVKTILKKETKFAKSATGTNMYFCIYKSDNEAQKYSTPSFEELIEIQKQEAILKKEDKVNVPPFLFDKKNNKYSLAFYLQPNDLVYLPTHIEIENPELVDFSKLDKSQVNRIYKFTDGSGTTANFIQNSIAKTIFNLNKKEQLKLNINYIIQNEFGLGSPQSKNQKSIDGIMIKENCWKLRVNRLGNIFKIVK